MVKYQQVKMQIKAREIADSVLKMPSEKSLEYVRNLQAEIDMLESELKEKKTIMNEIDKALEDNCIVR